MSVLERNKSFDENTYMLCLHGLFGGEFDWSKTAEYFKDDFTVLTLSTDFKGAVSDTMLKKLSDAKQGSTDNSDVIKSIAKPIYENLDTWLEEYVEENVPKDAKIIMGSNSAGSIIALRYLMTHRDRLKGFFLTGSAGLGETEGHMDLNPTQMFKALVNEDHSILKPLVQKMIFGNGADVSDTTVEQVIKLAKGEDKKAGARDIILNIQKLQAVGKSVQANVLNEDQINQINQIEPNFPTAVLWGDKDIITPVQKAIEFKEILRANYTKLFDDVGHSPQIEVPDHFNQSLEEFLIQTDLLSS